MKHFLQSGWQRRLMTGSLVLALAGCGSHHAAELASAQAQVQRIADDLDRKTTETGVYIRVDDGEIKETDPLENTHPRCLFARRHRRNG